MPNQTPLIATDARFARHQVLAQAIAKDLPQAELAHDHLHIMRVYRWCIRLAYEQGADGDLAGAAGLVHDCVHIPKDSASRPLASEASSEVAAGLLPQAGYSAKECAHIVEAVRTCSWSRGLEATGVLGRILQDADRLDALGVVGLLRTATCAQDMAPRSAGQLYHASDPLAQHGRPLDDRRMMLDHLQCKLLHLHGHFHCQSAQAEGARRHATLLQLREQLVEELCGIHPPALAPPYRTLLCDFDGTLVDSAPAITACLRQAAAVAEVGLGEDDAPLRALIGRPLLESLASWGLSGERLQRAFDAYRDAWFAGERDRCTLYPGVRATLELLRQEDCRICIASAKDHARLPDAVARIGLSDVVDAVFGALPDEPNKHGLVARAVQSQHPGPVAMVGDRCFDGEAAQHAGIPFLAAAYGYGSREELAACHPSAWLGHCTDLLSRVISE